MSNLVFLNNRKSAFGFKNNGKPKPEPTRNEKIISMRGEGKTFREIAETFGISIPRAQQICKNG